MALDPNGYTAAGAGAAPANGRYVPCTGASSTFGGATQFTNAGDFLAYNSGAGRWEVQLKVNGPGNYLPQYYSPAAAATDPMPLSGWVAAGGSQSAPTFTANNPAVVAGGPPITLSLTISGSNSAPQGNGVYAPPANQFSAPVRVSAVNVNGGTSAPGNTATANGWTVTANNDYATGSVQAPASAAPGNGYLVQVGEPSGYGSASFDVVAGSGQALAPTSFTDALLSDVLTRFGVTRRPAAFSDPLFSDALTVTLGASPSKGSLFFADALFSDRLTAGPRIGAAQVFTDALLSDTFSPLPVTLAPSAFTDSLLSDSLTAGRRTFGAQAFTDPLFSDAGGRTGHPAPSGHTSPPFVFTDALFSDGFAAAPRNGSPRTFTDSLLSGSLARTGYARTVTFTDALLSDFGRLPPVRPAPLPQDVDQRDPFVVMAQELRFLLSQTQGNPMTQNQAMLAILDKLAASYRVNELSLLANTLTALPTLIRGGDGVSSTIYGFGADAPILALLPAAETIIAGSSPNVVLAAIYKPLVAALAAYCSKIGFASLDAYLTSLNTPAPYQALVHPNTALINWIGNNGSGTLLLSPGNVFAPQTLFGMGTVGAGAAVAFQHLSGIPAANVVSPSAFQSTQGYTASKGCAANVTAAVNGTLTATLTASGQNAAGQAVTGRKWTAVLDNAAAGASVAFTPQVAGDRVGDITACTGAGAATAGAFNLNSVLERVVS